MRDGPSPDTLVALLLLGVVLFNYPLLLIIDGAVTGVPLLWLGLFVVWGVFIALLAWIHRGD